MKKLKQTLQLLLCLILCPVFALSQEMPQDISTCAFNPCNSDLSVPIPELTLATGNFSYAKSLSAINNDVDYFPEPECDDTASGTTTCENMVPSLVYKVYYPDKINGTNISYGSNCGLPGVIMFHGGSFWECSDYESDGISAICEAIAKRGSVVFKVEYRRGSWNDKQVDPTGDFRYLTAQQLLAIYRASQDARGAIRSIIKRESSTASIDHPYKYRIDTGKIFIGGMSAGSMIAMHAAYYERQDQIDASYPNVSAALGDIDQDYYYGDTTINYLPYIKGVLNMWGAMIMHSSKATNPASFFNGNIHHAPLIAFQGKKDYIFPFDAGPVYFSATYSTQFDSPYYRNFNSESHCVSSALSLDNSNGTYDAIAIGADRLYHIFKYKGWMVEEYLDCNMTHGLQDDCTTSVCNPYLSNFGTLADSKAEVFEYIAGRTATFFLAVINNLDLNRSRFVDCPNLRVRCDEEDDADCGYDSEDEAEITCSE